MSLCTLAQFSLCLCVLLALSLNIPLISSISWDPAYPFLSNRAGFKSVYVPTWGPWSEVTILFGGQLVSASGSTITTNEMVVCYNDPRIGGINFATIPFLNATAPVPSPRSSHSLLYLAEVQGLLMSGGYDSITDIVFDEIWFFSMESFQWSFLGASGAAQNQVQLQQHAMAALYNEVDGSYYVALHGGLDSNGISSNELITFIYEASTTMAIQTNSLKFLQPTTSPYLSQHSMFWKSGGSLCIVFGLDNSNNFQNAIQCAPSTGGVFQQTITFTLTAPNTSSTVIPAPRGDATIAWFDRSWYVYSGVFIAGNFYGDLFKFDLDTLLFIGMSEYYQNNTMAYVDGISVVEVNNWVPPPRCYGGLLYFPSSSTLLLLMGDLVELVVASELNTFDLTIGNWTGTPDVAPSSFYPFGFSQEAQAPFESNGISSSITPIAIVSQTTNRIGSYHYWFGGCDPSFEFIYDDLYVFDEITFQWIIHYNSMQLPPGTTAWPPARCSHATVSFGGTFYVYGGASNVVYGDVWKFNPQWNNFTLVIPSPPFTGNILVTVPPTPTPRVNHMMVLDGGHRSLVFAGVYNQNDNGVMNDLWWLDMDALSWTQITPNSDSPLPSPRFSSYQSGAYDTVTQSFYMFGGGNFEVVFSDVCVFNFITNMWTILSVANSVQYHVVSWTPDRELILTFGATLVANLASIYRIDPSNLTNWQLLDSTLLNGSPEPRSSQTVVSSYLDPYNRFLIFGGDGYEMNMHVLALDRLVVDSVSGNDLSCWLDGRYACATVDGSIAGYQVRSSGLVMHRLNSTKASFSPIQVTSAIDVRGISTTTTPSVSCQGPVSSPSISITNTFAQIENVEFSSMSFIQLTGSTMLLANVIFSGLSNALGAGGALQLYDCSLSASGSVFSQNVAATLGGALWGFDSNVLLSNSTFHGNSAGQQGGAAFLLTSTSTFDSVIWEGNQAPVGGAIAIQGWSQFSVYTDFISEANFQSNSFLSNVAPPSSPSGGLGGALSIQSTDSVVLQNNVFEGNIANSSGGAIYVVSSPSIVWLGNTWQENDAVAGGAVFWSPYQYELDSSASKPEWNQTLNVEGVNIAQYGSLLASPSYAIAWTWQDAAPPLLSQISGSGYSTYSFQTTTVFPTFEVIVVDAYNNTVSTDSVSAISLIPSSNFVGTTLVPTQNGIASFENLQFVAEPGTEVSVTVQAVLGLQIVDLALFTISSVAFVSPQYNVSIGVRIAIFATAGVVTIAILICSLYLFIHRSDAIIRASSTKFTAVTLMAMLWLAGSSVFYAIVPSSGSGSDGICNARLWCSCLSLMTILGILVAKSFRVSVIFGSRILMQVRAVTDAYVAGIVGALLLVEVVMLVIFTTMSMTSAELVSNGNNEVVWACNTSDAFSPWMGVQIGIFALVMVAGAVVAFRTRSVPSAFNESNHILQSLQMLLFMLVILAPLDWALVSNSPEASVVIQGGGQILLAFALWLSNFGPKMYFIAVGRGNDKSMIFNTVGASVLSGTSGSTSSYTSTKSHRNSGSGRETGDGNGSVAEEGTELGRNTV